MMKKKGVDLHDFSEYGLYCRERIGNAGLGKTALPSNPKTLGVILAQA